MICIFLLWSSLPSYLCWSIGMHTDADNRDARQDLIHKRFQGSPRYSTPTALLSLQHLTQRLCRAFPHLPQKTVLKQIISLSAHQFHSENLDIVICPCFQILIMPDRRFKHSNTIEGTQNDTKTILILLSFSDHRQHWRRASFNLHRTSQCIFKMRG